MLGPEKSREQFLRPPGLWLSTCWTALVGLSTCDKTPSSEVAGRVAQYTVCYEPGNRCKKLRCYVLQTLKLLHIRDKVERIETR
jgi:hypothetical protein